VTLSNFQTAGRCCSPLINLSCETRAERFIGGDPSSLTKIVSLYYLGGDSCDHTAIGNILVDESVGGNYAVAPYSHSANNRRPIANPCAGPNHHRTERDIRLLDYRLPDVFVTMVTVCDKNAFTHQYMILEDNPIRRRDMAEAPNVAMVIDLD
jgi:hypothetical protein